MPYYKWIDKAHDYRRGIKRSDKYCPICQTKTVSKPMRQCTKCKLNLLWNIDSSTELDKNYEYYYRWYKPVYSPWLEGWYCKEYFFNPERWEQ
jgi:hypothetical protein